MPKHYAFCHPGKIGDALYILPALQKICREDDAVATFITSEMCRPAEALWRYQDYVVDFVVPPSYVIDNEGQGIQPWQMPVDGEYDKVFQLGYEHHPRGPLHHYTANQLEVMPVPDPVYKFPEKVFYTEPYVVTCFNNPRGYLEMREAYCAMIEQCPIKVVQTGTSDDHVETPSENQIGLDLLEVLSLLAHAKLYVGFYSGILALANGFPALPKIVTLTTRGCGDQHGLHLPNTTEVVYPSPSSTPTERARRFQEELINTVIWGVDKWAGISYT